MASTINASNSGAGGLISAGDASGVLALQTAGTTAVTITAAQNIGIGTATPTDDGGYGKIVDISGSTGGAVYLHTSTATNYAFLGKYNSSTQLADSGSAGLTFATASGSTPVERMRIDSSGNVGIGTSSPSKRLSLRTSSADVGMSLGTGANAFNQDIDFFNSADVMSGRIRYYPDAGFMSFWTASSERMRIDSSGNLGIGTSSPSSYGKLTVANTAADTRIYVLDDIANGRGGYLQSNFSDAVILGTTSGVRSLVFSPDNTERMRLTVSGSLILAGSTAQKATGTTWSNPSDQRLKDNIRDYAKGMTELMQVRVREWEYNGKGGTVEGTKGLGVIADEVMTVLPNTVENYDAKLNDDDDETTAIKKFDATEITWLLVKAFQELKTEFDEYKATHP